MVSSLKGRGDQSTLDALIARFAKCSGWNNGQYYGNEKDGGIFDEMLNLRIETLKQYGYETKFRTELGDDDAAIQAKLVETATPWAEQFDANALIALRRSVIQFDCTGAVGNIKSPILYALSRTDNLFPPSIAPDAMALFEKHGIDARFHEIDSDNGHTAPGTDWQVWCDVLEDFLDAKAA